MNFNLDPLVIGGGLVLGAFLGYLGRQLLVSRQASSVESKLKERIEKAEVQAKQAIVSAKDEAASLIEKARGDIRQREGQLSRLEERLIRKEDSVDRQKAEVDEGQKALEAEKERLRNIKAILDQERTEVAGVLEKVSGLKKEEAKQQLFEQVQNQHKDELASLLVKLEREKKEAIEKRGAEIITAALQRYARSQVSDVTTSVIALPNDDLKGKIIGREGRNIKALEHLTGVEIIIDETPSLTLSSFDPLRREVCKLAVEKLIKDGRIQPARIEEKVEEAKLALNDKVSEAGEAAVYELGIMDLPKEIINLLGRLNYRSSFGQNVLFHSIETAHLAGMIAGELGLKVDIVKKAALLHDIGKAIDHDVPGTHVELGMKILKKYNIGDEVIKGMQAHHEDYPFSTPESFVIAAADALSSARPGARRDNLENYLKRLEELEKTASSFEGVKTAYAISAGRELRVFVVPEKIDDFGALQLAKNIASKVQGDLRYPGEIKVNVIREVRAVEYAR